MIQKSHTAPHHAIRTRSARSPVNVPAALITLLAAAFLWAATWHGAWAAIADEDAAEGELIDRIVAVVENDVVMQSELDARVALIKRQLAARSPNVPPEDILRRQILDRMILERLQLELANRIGIRIDDVTLNDTMRRLAEQNNMTLARFRDVMVAEGIDYAAFRDQLRNELTIEKLRAREVSRRVKVTDQEIDEYLASQSGQAASEVQYHIRHILVAVPEAATPAQLKAAREKAEAIRAKALEGADFAQLAIQSSDGQNALDGGDLGMRKASDLPALFARQVALMGQGDISEVIRSPSGFHVIKVEERLGDTKTVVNQTLARHILVKTSAVISDQDAELRLASLRDRILNGDDFAALAKANSDDGGTAANGGDLGWANPGDFVPEFEEVMNGLEIGEISEPFHSPFGWHIIQVLDRRQYDSTEGAQRTKARKIIFKRKAKEETELWLRRLRDESYIEYVAQP